MMHGAYNVKFVNVQINRTAIFSSVPWNATCLTTVQSVTLEFTHSFAYGVHLDRIMLDKLVTVTLEIDCSHFHPPSYNYAK